MDPITHGLLGACSTQAVYQSRYPDFRLWVFGLLAAMAPDLDIIFYRAHDPLYSIYYHRNFTHALAFIPVGATIIALLGLLLWPRYRTIAFAMWVSCLIGYASHGLLDCLTSYGTMWYWPFTEKRVAWDIISIVDPKVTVILLLGVVASAVLSSAFAARITLLLTALLFSFAAVQHQRVVNALVNFSQNKWQIAAFRAMPGLASLSNYSCVIRTTDKKIQTLRVKLSGLNQYKIIQGPEFKLFTQQDLPKSIANNPILLQDFQIFSWFSDDYVAAFQHTPLLIVDMRYFQDYTPPYRALWGVEFPNEPKGHVIWRSGVSAR